MHRRRVAKTCLEYIGSSFSRYNNRYPIDLGGCLSYPFRIYLPNSVKKK